MHALSFISIIFLIAALASPSWVEGAVNSQCNLPFGGEEAGRDAFFGTLADQGAPGRVGITGDIQQIDVGLGVAQYAKSQISTFKGNNTTRTVVSRSRGCSSVRTLLANQAADSLHFSASPPLFQSSRSGLYTGRNLLV